MLASIRKGQGIASVGRPKGSASSDVLGTSTKNLDCFVWLQKWIAEVGDDDPVGKSFKKVVNFVTVQDLHQEYCKYYGLKSVLLRDLPLSERRFRDIWQYFKTKERVRVRRKANTTTKFGTCDELHARATAVTATQADIREVTVSRARHRDEIRSLRLCYMTDIQRAQSSYTFQTIVFDGTNSNTCKCPQDWRSHLRNEKGNNTYVPQKIQSILIHGIALLFYVVTPCVALGMNLTISTVIDAIQYLDPRTEVVRFQFDGNLFMHCTFFLRVNLCTIVIF
jgi:hypothetical protein